MDKVSQTKFDLHPSKRTMPKYERLKDHILDEFHSGRLQPGDALPTEADLAVQMQVARSTVRKALSSLDSDGFINRIRGKGTFVRNDAKQRLSRGLGLMALIMPESSAGHYPSLQEGFERAAAETHSQVIVSTTGNDTTRQGNAILQLMSKEVAGVAIVPTMTPTPEFQIEMLKKQGIPVVFCHRRVPGVRAPLVSIPFLEVGHMAGRELVRRGHRRVAMFYSLPVSKHMLPVHGHMASPSGIDYGVGLREVLRQSGGDLPEEFILSVDTNTLDLGTQEKEAWPKIKELFSRPDRPTAIMTSFDSIGEIVYLALERLGLRIPEDVSVISFGSKERQGAITRRLNSVVVDGTDVGRQAARLINEMCCGQRAVHDTEEIQTPLYLSEGRSLGPVKTC